MGVEGGRRDAGSSREPRARLSRGSEGLLEMRRWGRRGGEGRRPAAEGDWSGAVVCAGAERARARPLWGPQRVPRSGAGCSGLTMEGARRRR